MNATDNLFMTTIKMPRHTRDTIDAPDFATTTQSGRVAFDERGNSIWEWQTSPGVFTRDISMKQLQDLQANDLTVVEHESAAAISPSAWSRRLQPRKMSEGVEMVMPARRREDSQRGFEAFIRRLVLAAS